MPEYQGPTGIVRATGALAAVFDADERYVRTHQPEEADKAPADTKPRQQRAKKDEEAAK